MAVIEIVDPKTSPLEHGSLPDEGWVGVRRDNNGAYTLVFYLYEHFRPPRFEGTSISGEDGDRNFLFALYGPPAGTATDAPKHWHSPLGMQQLERSLFGFADAARGLLEVILPEAMSSPHDFNLWAIRLGAADDFWRFIVNRMSQVAQNTGNYVFTRAAAIEQLANQCLGPNWGSKETDRERGRLDALLRPIREREFPAALKDEYRSEQEDEAFMRRWMALIVYVNSHKRALMDLIHELYTASR